MPGLKFNASADGGSGGTARPMLHGGALMAANEQVQARLAQAPALGQDARGRALRQRRLELGMDAANLATRACLSLHQLYQLETGEDTLFYSSTLRNQAGRRVAALLGADWEQLALASQQQSTAD